jgi:hypothetical protein
MTIMAIRGGNNQYRRSQILRTCCYTNGRWSAQKTLQNAVLEPLTHPNIRKTGSIRNRQISGSAKCEEGISAQLQPDFTGRRI